MEIRVAESSLSKISASALLVFAYDDAKPFDPPIDSLDSAIGGQLRGLVQSGEMSGRFKEFAILHPKGISASHLIVVGVGKRKEFTLDRFRSVCAKGARIARRAVADDLAIPIAGMAGMDPEASATAAVEGVLLGLYRFRKYKTKKRAHKEGALNELVLIVKDPSQIKKAEAGVHRGKILCDATTLVRDLVNEPSNVITPTTFSKIASTEARKSGVDAEILEKSDIEDLGMGAFLSVAKGSSEPPKLVILRYRGGGKSSFTLGLVGKGVTFDSGGISIKPSEDMHHMTDDMAGAAACLGAISAIARLGLPLNVVAALPLAENLPDGKASKPGDIVNTHAGKTIEILNTDAEGRLLLADVLSYVSKMKVDAVVDVATLTGGIRVALGHAASGVFSTNDKLLSEILKASDETHEVVWPMPLLKEYSIQTRGSLADLKNAAGRLGSPCTAAAFLKEFVGKVPWAHLDIAGTARIEGDKIPFSLHCYLPKDGATGVGVRLLTVLAERLSRLKGL